MTLSAAQVNALRIITGEAVFITNRGQSNVKGLTAQTFASLRRAGLATVNGASRATVKGKSARRAVLTSAGRAVLSVNV